MQQGCIKHLDKIEFSEDLEISGKNTQLKIKFKSEVKVILFLWKNQNT